MATNTGTECEETLEVDLSVHVEPYCFEPIINKKASVHETQDSDKDTCSSSSESVELEHDTNTGDALGDVVQADLEPGSQPDPPADPERPW